MRRRFQDDQFSDIWRSAQRRRADDLYAWIIRAFARQARRGWSTPRQQRRKGRGAVITGNLDMSRAVPQTTHTET